MEWIKDILENNKKKVSIIHFVRTPEYLRPFHLLLALRKNFKSFLLYDPWNGLRRVTFHSNNELREDPIEPAEGDQFGDPNDPVGAMQRIIHELKTGHCLAVMEQFDSICERVNALPNMNDALRSLIREYDYRPNAFEDATQDKTYQSMLVLFLKDTTHVAKDILDHTLLYNVVGSTEDERRKSLEIAVKEREKQAMWVPKKMDTEGIVSAGAGLTIIQFNTSIVMAFSVKQVTPQYVSSAKRLILEASGIGKITTPETAINPDKIGGYENVKEMLRTIANKVTNRAVAEKLGCGNVRGILFFGPPGVGKTLFAKVVAKLTNHPVVEVSAADIFSKWYGESSQKIRKIIEVAEEAQAIIFIDEIESIVGSRGTVGQQTGQHEETARTLGELLRYMGDPERKGIVIGTTNLPNAMDFAMMRAGRFDRIIYISLPNESARKAIFEVHLNNPIDHSKVNVDADVNLDELVKLTKCFSGAEIAQLVKDACVKPDTIILGDNKEISQYNVGENVFGMGNTKNSIKKTFIRNFEGEMVKIKPKYLLPIEVTPEHPILTASIEICYPRKDEFQKYGQKTIRKITSFQWKLAKDIEKNEGIIIPRLEGIYSPKNLSLKSFVKRYHSARKFALERGLPLDEEVAWAMGLYVAEGSVGQRNFKNIVFSLGKTEEKLANRIKILFGERFGYKFYEEFRGNSRRVLIYTTVLGRAFTEWFGRGAKNKKIPDFLLLHKDKNILRSFLQGFLDGDGSISKVRDEITLSTSSQLLALQIQLALARFGILMGIGINKLKRRKLQESTLPEGIIFNLRSRREEVFDFFEIKRKLKSYRKDYHVFDKYIVTMISEVSSIPYSGNVYNLATENNTYLVSNGVVHNCDYAFDDNSATVKMAHFTEAIEMNRPNMEERHKMVKMYDGLAKLFCRGLRQKQREKMIPENTADVDPMEANLGRFR